MEARRGRPTLLLGVALLLALAMGRAEASRAGTARRMLQAQAGVDALSLEESKGIAVDPSECAVGQYSVAVTLTAASIPKTEACVNADGTATPYVDVRMGGKTVRSKTVGDNFPAYLETLQFGCQDTANPVAVTVVNAANGKVCFQASLMDWAKGRRAAYTEAQEPESAMGGFSLVKDTMQSFSYNLQQSGSAATVDLSIMAYPGPVAMGQQWKQHTAGDTVGIVVGMMAFMGLVAAFVYRIRQGSASSAAGPGDIVVGAATAAAAAAEAAPAPVATAPAVAEPPKRTRQQGKLGVEVRGADIA